jgi:ferrochelatase
VQPFLQNLFSDPAIIAAPTPIRWLLARLISRRRAPVAQKIYAELGGRSPLLPNTEAQAGALHEVLGDEAKVLIAMRYWHPLIEETVHEVRTWAPERIVLLPLYPQFSTTTTQSSFDAWDRAAAEIGLGVPTARLCCYPDDPGFVAASARLLAKTLDLAGGPARVLFSAHGLPKRVVERGDPYPWQVERSAKAIAEALGRSIDGVVCYQSRVGPLEWIGPSTEAEIRRAAADKLMPVIVPLSFVSEHSETLVELDREYRDLAEAVGAPGFLRVPTVSTDALFIDGLARLVRAAPVGLSSGCGRRICPAEHRHCPNGAT